MLAADVFTAGVLPFGDLLRGQWFHAATRCLMSRNSALSAR